MVPVAELESDSDVRGYGGLKPEAKHYSPTWSQAMNFKLACGGRASALPSVGIFEAKLSVTAHQKNLNPKHCQWMNHSDSLNENYFWRVK